MPELIDTTTMPGDDMSPELIEAAATNFRSVGGKVATRGGTVLTRWQAISGVYDAPEETTLTQAMNPVKTKAEAFGTDLDAAAKALDTFADQVRTIKAEVARIRGDAASLLGGIVDGKVTVTYYGGGDYYTEPFDWHTDQATVDANNALIRRTNDQQEALWAAERACASAIRAAVGLGPVLAADAGNPNGYGVNQIPDDASMPWGSTGERTEGCLEKTGEGVVDAGASALSGLGNLVGISYTDDEGFGWSLGTAGDAWGGMLKFGVGAAAFSLPGLIAGQALPGPVGRYVRDAQFTVPATAAGLAGIDLYAKDPLHKWRNDPAHTSGGLLFNLATLPLAALKVTKAGSLGKLGRGTPDTPDLHPGKLPDGTGTIRDVDPSDLTGLSRKADLDGSLTINTDLDIPVGKADGDGPPTGRTDSNGPPTDRTDSDNRGQDTTPDAGRPDSDPAGGNSRPADQPVIGSGTGTPDDKRVYGYENRAEALRGTPKPTDDELGRLGRSKAYTPGTIEHMQTTWRDYLAEKNADGKTPKSWEAWRDQYITNQGNPAKGKAFELAYRAVHPQYDAGGYEFGTYLPKDIGVRRKYDVFSVPDTEGIELKSTDYLKPDQLAKDAKLVRDGWTIRYVFGEPPSPSTLKRLEALGIEAETFHTVPVLIE